MPKIKINGQEVDVQDGMTVLQACEMIGIEIPKFCYHEKLSIAGNCRMCLVEMEKSPKPIASCAMPVSENMVIHTNTPAVKKAREGVMEFLLINHPLDCPICDQAGECDLQDQSLAYGKGYNRFQENKRSVKDKYMGPLIKTHMTRCIHCTRCIRFANEIAGVEELGATGRGEQMEVGTYIEKSITSELSGNLIDLCPVGALTSKPYAFKARSWELKKTETIDVLDAVGSNIRVDSRGLEVMRILPRINEDINEEWISDKTRFAYDGLKLQRLDTPMVKKDGKLTPVEWDEAYKLIKDKLLNVDPNKIAAIVGDLVDCESMFMLKKLMNKIGSNIVECRQDGTNIKNDSRSGYLFNTTISGIENADLCLLVGSNPRYEASMINLRLRKRYLSGGFEISSIGLQQDLTYPVNELGNDVKILEQILIGNHEFVSKIKQAKNPMIIIGDMALTRDDNEAVLNIAQQIAEKYNFINDNWNGFNILHTAASRVGGLDLGLTYEGGLDKIFKSIAEKHIEIVYLFGADEIDMHKLGDSFVIYQGHHGDKGAHRADVILPGAAYTEKHATYVNLEGRVQKARSAVSPPGKAKQDWVIFNQLSQFLDVPLNYKNIDEVNRAMVELSPHLGELDYVKQVKWRNNEYKYLNFIDKPFMKTIENYYMTNSITRASKIMAECSNILEKTIKAA